MHIIKNLCDDLNLPYGDRFTQDWAYELPDQYRTKYWLNKYIFAYLYNGYSSIEKKELMILSLDVCNDLISSGLNPNDKVIQKVLNILFNNYKNYEDLINYWALDSAPLIDCFALTPIIRELKYQNYLQHY
ncbi:hypothetical protein [Gilliamella sp. GillExp13]|uniref:hypothetical protein n=1 Tax=Gilliamella sp. GillExp13 TaxID=3120243 RepID=UPI00080DAECE|nr:hypothetical protein [Gilliamella apicola]OCG58538.1 hypothetical protein A9G37_06620 [Gilliamella apicola]